jgi:peptidoglycan hydrolase CwlO-like protein
MLRKILAVLLILCASVGLLLCVAGLLGVWVANTPLTDAITTTTAAGHEYLTTADETVTTIHEQVQRFQSEVDSLQASVPEMTAETRAAVTARINATVQPWLGEPVANLRTTLTTLAAGATSLNSALESANRIPGVNLPTFTEELATAEQRLDEIRANVATLQAAAADLSIDGSRLEAALAAVAERLVAIDDLLVRLQSQVVAIDQALVAFGAAAPGWIDWGSVVLSLLAILFGAGQVSLIQRGVGAWHAA